MSLGRLWPDGVLFGPNAGALVVDPSPLFRAVLGDRLRGLGAQDVEEAASARERGILRLVAEGHTNKEIGAKVDLSALTVKSHLAHIARKLGTGDRAHMVALGIRSGVIN